MENDVSQRFGPDERRELLKAIEKGFDDPSLFSSLSGVGPVAEFESAFAASTGGKYALALSSCTAAIHVSLMALGIGPGDEVICSPYTWGQSVAPVIFTGATVVFADIDAQTLTIDPNSVEERMSSRTKAILPVHIFGIPADMDSLCKIARKNGLKIIADAAQAFGAFSKGRKLGSLGDVACYSLGRGKAVYGGEGGVLVTNDEILYERAVAISQHPLRASREVFSETVFPFDDALGWNYRIHPFAALLSLADLKNAEGRVARWRSLSIQAHHEIRQIPAIEPVRCHPEDTTAAYRIPLTYKSQQAKGISREAFIRGMEKTDLNLFTGPVNVPIHLRTAFRNRRCRSIPLQVHWTHQKGTCQKAEYHCKSNELEAISHNFFFLQF